MDQPKSDALVFFGATGDLAYKQIFPSLQRLAKRGKLTGPVIGVAKAGWNLDQLKARAKDSVEKHGGIDPEGLADLLGRLRYVDGDYADASTFAQVRKGLGGAKIRCITLPSHHFFLVQCAKSLRAPGPPRERAWSSRSPSVTTLNPRGRSTPEIHGVFDEDDIYRIDHYLGKNTVQNMIFFRFANFS